MYKAVNVFKKQPYDIKLLRTEVIWTQSSTNNKYLSHSMLVMF